MLSEFFEDLITALDGNGKPVQLILISPVDDPQLAQRLCKFAVASREVAERVANAKAILKANPKNGPGADSPTVEDKQGRRRSPSLVLRDYFDEYAGQSKTRARAVGVRKSEHGLVVKALEAAVRSSGLTRKAQAIDLALVQHEEVRLYEVKTSARTTDIYTALGQLLIHGACINELLDLPVKRYLVLPEEPWSQHARHMASNGLKVVIYQKRGKGYSFEGL